MVVATKEQVDAVFRVGVGGRRLRDSEYILDVENMLVTNMKEAMLKLGGTLAKNLSKNAPVSSGKLSDPDTFYVDSVRETKTGFRLEIKVGVDYYDYIDKGVKGIKNRRKTYPNADGRFYQFKTYGMPIEALQSLEGWMKRKNMEIEATNLIEGRQMLPQISSNAKRLAYYIKKYGIEGRQFIKQSINESTPQFNLDIKSIGSDSLVLKISK
jgi:hypothetical protein